MNTYDAGWVRAHFDDFAEREWERLDDGPVSRIKFEVHAHYLAQPTPNSRRIAFTTSSSFCKNRERSLF